MADFSALKALINANIKTNGRQEITGSLLNSVLIAMVDSVNSKKIDTNALAANGNIPVYDAGGSLIDSGESLAELLYNIQQLDETVSGKADQDDVDALGDRMTEVETDLTDVIGQVDEISGLIPDQADEDNILADRNFVNSTVQTSSANPRGNWPTFADVPTDAALYPADYAGSHIPTVNDYMTVADDETHSHQMWRYKYSGVWSEVGKAGWVADYKVNDTPFTAAQLAAINSNATAALITKLGALPTATELAASLLEKYVKPSSGIPASDLASGVIPSVPTKLSQLEGDSTHRTVTDAEKTTWGNKQNAISDLNSIRSGAEAGSTALQDAPSDGTQYARKNGAWVEVEAEAIAIENYD